MFNPACSLPLRLSRLILAALLSATALPVIAATAAEPATASVAPVPSKADLDLAKRAAEWAAKLQLNDPAREARVSAVITTHLKAVRDWHNSHPASTVPAGINPVTGQPLSILDREIIADSAMPRSVHEALMQGLRADLTEPQVEFILDQYTIGKVAFTMKGYHAIVPDLTEAEAATILGFLKQAREQAVGYKNMKQISAIFEIYKTKSEQFLNANGRNWSQLYKTYTNGVKAQKAAAAKAKAEAK